jgi:hypothetical protein
MIFHLLFSKSGNPAPTPFDLVRCCCVISAYKEDSQVINPLALMRLSGSRFGQLPPGKGSLLIIA